MKTWPPVIKELTLKIRHVVHQQIASLFLVLPLKVPALCGFPYLIQRGALQPVFGEWVARLSCPLSSERLEKGEEGKVNALPDIVTMWKGGPEPLKMHFFFVLLLLARWAQVNQ